MHLEKKTWVYEHWEDGYRNQIGMWVAFVRDPDPDPNDLPGELEIWVKNAEIEKEAMCSIDADAVRQLRDALTAWLERTDCSETPKSTRAEIQFSEALNEVRSTMLKTATAVTVSFEQLKPLLERLEDIEKKVAG